MFRTLTATALLIAGLGNAALAETFEVKMLNKGEAGRMVFEPGFLQIAPGDTVSFVVTDKGHNAETDKNILPEGAEPFVGKMSKNVEVTFDVEGIYGVKCKPHYAMGMVMSIAVGDVTEVSEDTLAGRIPKKAKARYEEQLSGLK